MVAAGIKGKPSRAGNPTYPRMLLPERYSDEGVPRARSVCSARGHQDLVSRKTFGRRCSTLGAPPLPTSSGEPCSILGITATIEAAAVQVGLPRRPPEGLTLWTWHVFQVGGAQSLAIAEWDRWTIQLVGRWSTEVVLAMSGEASWPCRTVGPHEHPRVLRWAHSWAPSFQDPPSRTTRRCWVSGRAGAH